jgi:hypothetical protein
MKSSFTLLTLASMLVVGCAGSSPLSPTAASPSRVTSLSASSGSADARPFFPPINPVGISCPSDAPQILVGSLGTRLDVEFSEVAGAYAYEIEIVNRYNELTRLEVPAPAGRAEWYGPPGLYRVRVRTMNCGGLGNWSAEVLHAIDDATVQGPASPIEPPPVPPKGPKEPTEPTEPHCMIGCF